ncbi:MAG: AAA family ATPase [Candidatus Aenigmatarchaeota archaeon]
MEEFDKILEEIIWASCALRLNEIKIIAENYPNMASFLYQKGDPLDRPSFYTRVELNRGKYNFNKLIDEVISLFNREFPFNFSIPVFLIGIRNNDEKLINTAYKTFYRYYNKMSLWDDTFWKAAAEGTYKNLKEVKVTERVIETDKKLNKKGKIVNQLFNILETLYKYKAPAPHLPYDDSVKKLLKLLIDYEIELKHEINLLTSFFSTVWFDGKGDYVKILKDIIDFDRKLNSKGKIIINSIKGIKEYTYHIEEEDKIELFKLIVNYEKEINGKGDIIKEATRFLNGLEKEDKIEVFKLIVNYEKEINGKGDILKDTLEKFYSFRGEYYCYYKEIIELIIDFEREKNKKGEFIKGIIENSYIKGEGKIDTLKLLIEYEKELPKDSQIVENFVLRNLRYKEFIPHIIEYDKENKKNGTLIQSFIERRKMDDIDDNDFYLVKSIIDYDIELSNNFSLLKIFLNRIPLNKILWLKGIYQGIIEYDRELGYKYKLTNVLGKFLPSRAFYLSIGDWAEKEEDEELYIEKKADSEVFGKDFSEISEQFEKIKDYFYYKEEDLKEIYKGLFKSDRHFVIFSGPPGTGKTAMAILIVASYLGIGFPNKRVKIKELLNAILNDELFKNHAVLLRTKPEWTSPKDVIGYRDINGNFHKGALYDLLENASKNKDKPFFIIIDEMNLSHPEHYLSDIISAMETGGTIQTDNGNLEYHGNIYILGTINNDETTQNLSQRLLSRAYKIETRVDWEEVKKRDNGDNKVEFLEKIDKILQNIGYGFGYRDIEECKNIVEDDKDMDNFLRNKLIPKLRGGDELIEVIEDLIKITEENRFEKTKELLQRKSEELKRKGFI